jgi:hypothetical protein
MRTPRATPNSEPRVPIVNGQRIRISPLAVSTACLFQTPSSEVLILDQTPPGLSFLSGPTLPRRFRDFADRGSSTQSFLAVGNPERRNPDSSGSCHLSFQRSMAPTESGNRYSRLRRACNSCTRQPRFAEMRWQMSSTCAWRLTLLQEFKSPILFLLKSSPAPKLLPFGLLLGLFPNTCKELSLLSFHQLSTQNHSGFNSSTRSHTQHMKEVRNKKLVCKGTMPTIHRK